MTAKQHMIIGGGVTVGTYILIKHIKKEKPSFSGFLKVALLGCLVGIIPDILEPSIHPNHRQFFHSLITLTGIGTGNYLVWRSPNLTIQDKLAITLTSAGYVSHLLIQATRSLHHTSRKPHKYWILMASDVNYFMLPVIIVDGQTPKGLPWV